MNRHMGQPWDLQSSLLWLHFSWKGLKPRLSTLPGTHQSCGSDMWMTLFSSKGQNIVTSLYSTSTPLTLSFKSPMTPTTDGSIPFLDTLVSPGPDDILLTSVYRKPTHIDQQLQWDSHHSLPAKYNVFNTLTHRARRVYANTQLLHKEGEHIKGSLLRCKYPKWALNRLQTNSNH